MLKIGHRGIGRRVSENTLASFKKAFELGADAVEGDVRRSRGGTWLLNHDRLVKWRLIAGTPFKKLLQVKELTTLNELLEWLADKKLTVILDVKVVSRLDELFMIIQKLRISDHIIFSTFHHRTIKTAKRLFPSMKAAMIVGSFWHTFLEEGILSSILNIPMLIYKPLIVRRAKMLGAEGIHIQDKLVSEKLLRMAHAAGLSVRVWTVNKPQEIAKFKAMGVDGIFSDFPERL